MTSKSKGTDLNIPEKFQKTLNNENIVLRGRYNAASDTFVTSLEEIISTGNANNNSITARQKLEAFLKSEIENSDDGIKDGVVKTGGNNANGNSGGLKKISSLTSGRIIIGSKVQETLEERIAFVSSLRKATSVDEGDLQVEDLEDDGTGGNTNSASELVTTVSTKQLKSIKEGTVTDSDNPQVPNDDNDVAPEDANSDDEEKDEDEEEGINVADLFEDEDDEITNIAPTKSNDSSEAAASIPDPPIRTQWTKMLIHQAPYFVRANSPLGTIAICSTWFPNPKRLGTRTDLELDITLQKLLFSNGNNSDNLNIGSTANSDYAIFLMRAGRFSGAIFNSCGKMLQHKNLSRYTVRAKQGGSQSAKDNTGKSIKSAGSQLRRYGEKALESDMQTLFKQWESALKKCGNNVFISGGQTQISQMVKLLPDTIQNNLLINSDNYSINNTKMPTTKQIPFPVKKPNLAEVEQLSVQLRAVHIYTNQDFNKLVESQSGGVSHAEATRDTEEGLKKIGAKTKNKKKDRSLTEADNMGPLMEKYDEEKDELFTPLHKACQDGDTGKIEEIIKEFVEKKSRMGVDGKVEIIDVKKKIKGASEKKSSETKDSETKDNPEEVKEDSTELNGNAEDSKENVKDNNIKSDDSDPIPDPNEISDIQVLLDPLLQRDSKSRVPYFLAATNNTRIFIRKLRGQFENDFHWDLANVPESITDEKEEAKKEKEREKKKKQRERQKANKEQKKIEDEEKRKKEEEAKKREAELLSGPPCSNPECKQSGFCGANPNKWIRKLDYVYCGGECVRGHQRILTAEAAAKRFGQ